MKYQVVYDVLRDGYRGGFAALLGIGFITVGLLLRRAASPKKLNVVVLGWAAPIFGVLGLIGAGNLFFQQARCKHWLKTGNFSVASGTVKDVNPMPASGHAYEHFTVDGVPFSYSDFNPSMGGFNNTRSHGGPIRQGLFVRVSHREGRILKLEVADETPEERADGD